MTDITAESLFEKYKSDFQEIVDHIHADRGYATPYVIIKITTSIVPQMASDLGQTTSLKGSEKKQLIIDAVELAINEIFRELNELPELSKETWDDNLKTLLLMLIGPTLDNLIAVEKGQLVFNKTITSGLSKIFRCSCLKGRK